MGSFVINRNLIKWPMLSDFKIFRETLLKFRDKIRRFGTEEKASVKNKAEEHILGVTHVDVENGGQRERAMSGCHRHKITDINPSAQRQTESMGTLSRVSIQINLRHTWEGNSTSGNHNKRKLMEQKIDDTLVIHHHSRRKLMVTCSLVPVVGITSHDVYNNR